MLHQGVKIPENINENIEPAVEPGSFGPLLINDNHRHIRLALIYRYVLQVDLINAFSQRVVVQGFLL